MDKIDKLLLKEVINFHKIPSGAFSIRKNGVPALKKSTKEIEIVSNESGIDVYIKPNTKNKSVHIPVIISIGNITDAVHNNFYVGENSTVTIIAGCGIHNQTLNKSEHNGIHSFYLKKGSKVKYIEKHYGSGDGKKILNPITNLFLEENCSMEVEMLQIEGVDSSVRKTFADLKDNSSLIVKENILTAKKQKVKTSFNVNLSGKNSSAEIISHSVAKDQSKQEFVSNLTGKNECFGHIECDGILLDSAKIISTPKISALSKNASLIHEAAIGKIAKDQIVKLMTLGLSENEAEQVIIEGFLTN